MLLAQSKMPSKTQEGSLTFVLPMGVGTILELLCKDTIFALWSECPYDVYRDLKDLEET